MKDMKKPLHRKLSELMVQRLKETGLVANNPIKKIENDGPNSGCIVFEHDLSYEEFKVAIRAAGAKGRGRNYKMLFPEFYDYYLNINFYLESNNRIYVDAN